MNDAIYRQAAIDALDSEITITGRTNSEDCESRTQIRTRFCPNCGAKMEED